MRNLLIILSLLLIGCESTKTAFKDKTQTNSTTTQQEQKNVSKESKTITERTREGGRLSTDILPISERPRDENGNLKELIQELKNGGLTKTIYYRPDGSASVDCNAADILERIEQNMFEKDLSTNNRITEIEQLLKVKDSTKEVETKDSFIYAIMGAIVLLGGFFMFIMYRSLNKHTKVLQMLSDRVG